jgi:hypothetical protein
MKFSLNGELLSTKSILLIFQRRALLPGLVGHLKNNFPTMFRLYEILKVRSDPPTQDELDIASAKKKLDDPAARAYVSQLEKASENIVDALQRQAAQAAASSLACFCDDHSSRCTI